MIVCPQGTFEKGSIDTNHCNPKETVSFKKAFLLGESEISQFFFQRIMGYNPSNFKGKDFGSVEDSNKRPIESITWYDAVMFCKKLSEKLGLTSYYNILVIEREDNSKPSRIKKAKVTVNQMARGFRLPFDSEWEYAAKAGTDNKYAGANDEGQLDQVAWFKVNSYVGSLGKTQAIKSKKPNKWGFYDMGGNVWEWCDDKEDITKPNDETNHAFRGGGWFSDEDSLLIVDRRFLEPDIFDSGLGFRIAKNTL
jgi:formylglycine-generating enzyme required for sulfatase activity